VERLRHATPLRSKHKETYLKRVLSTTVCGPAKSATTCNLRDLVSVCAIISTNAGKTPLPAKSRLCFAVPPIENLHVGLSTVGGACLGPCCLLGLGLGLVINNRQVLAARARAA